MEGKPGRFAKASLTLVGFLVLWAAGFVIATAGILGIPVLAFGFLLWSLLFRGITFTDERSTTYSSSRERAENSSDDPGAYRPVPQNRRLHTSSSVSPGTRAAPSRILGEDARRKVRHAQEARVRTDSTGQPEGERQEDLEFADFLRSTSL